VTRDLDNMKEKDGEHPKGDAVQMIGLVAFVVVWVVDSFFLQKTTLLAGFFPLYQRLAVLVLCAGIALYLFKSGHVVVSGDTRPDRVVSTGAFRYVRHPLYLGSMLLYFAFSFATGSLACLALILIMAALYNYIATYEEKLLVAKLGNEYVEYIKKTGKWFPKISGVSKGSRK